MRKKTFEEQFPGYEIVPMKESRLKWPLIWICTLTALIGLPAYYVYVFSNSAIPVSNLAGFNKNSVPTLGLFAIQQSESGQHKEATRNFAYYFKLGGTGTEAMVAYANSLAALGHNDLALQWANKAVASEPQSRAARFTKELLEKKSGKN